VRVLDAFGRGRIPSPLPCNCNALRFGFGLNPAFGRLLDGLLIDTVLAFCAFAAAVSALFCALAAASSWALTYLAFFASSLATLASSFSFFLTAAALDSLCLFSAFLRVSAS
jgi:hypothetical protein